MVDYSSSPDRPKPVGDAPACPRAGAFRAHPRQARPLVGRQSWRHRRCRRADAPAIRPMDRPLDGPSGGPLTILMRGEV